MSPRLPGWRALVQLGLTMLTSMFSNSWTHVILPS
ncbi:hypothetical protein AAY473_015548 [Plecturocebus cupreus]